MPGREPGQLGRHLPIAAGVQSAEHPLEHGARHLGATRAVRVVQEELGAVEHELVGTEGPIAQRPGRRGTGTSLEETDVHRERIPRLLRERVAAHDRVELGRRARDHVDAEPERVLERVLDRTLDGGRAAGPARQDDVAALDVRGDVVHARVRERVADVGHLHPPRARDVDAPQQRDVRRHAHERRPRNASMRVWSSAPAGGVSSGPHTPGPRNASPNAGAAASTRCTSSGSMCSSRPAARARSQPCTTRSKEMNRSMASSKLIVPIWPSNVSAARAGSSRSVWTTLRAASNAATGSSSTEGIEPSSRPTRRRNMPWVWTTWSTTSRAVQPSHGDGRSHRSPETPATFSANAPESRSYRSEISLMSTPPPTRSHSADQHAGRSAADLEETRHARADRAANFESWYDPSTNTPAASSTRPRA